MKIPRRAWVDIDEAGRDDQPARVHASRGGRVRQVPHGGDGVPVDPDLAEEPRTARAIDNFGSGDQHVEAWLGEERRRKETKEAESRAHSGYCNPDRSEGCHRTEEVQCHSGSGSQQAEARAGRFADHDGIARSSRDGHGKYGLARALAGEVREQAALDLGAGVARRRRSSNPVGGWRSRSASRLRG